MSEPNDPARSEERAQVKAALAQLRVTLGQVAVEARVLQEESLEAKERILAATEAAVESATTNVHRVLGTLSDAQDIKALAGVAETVPKWLDEMRSKVDAAGQALEDDIEEWTETVKDELDSLLDELEDAYTEQLEEAMEEMAETLDVTYEDVFDSIRDDLEARLQAQLSRLETFAHSLAFELEVAVEGTIEEAKNHAEERTALRVREAAEKVVDKGIQVLMDELGLNTILLQIGTQTTTYLSPHIIELRLIKELIPLIEKARMEF